VNRENKKEKDDPCPILATNVIGHFLLTHYLLDKCQRVVNVASVMHHFPLPDDHDYDDNDNNRGGDDDDDIIVGQVDFWKRVAQGQARNTYGASKLAALLFTLELNHRYYGKSKGIRSIAVNPGAV